MKLAAHQPCYLPSISFFHKFILADVFVLANDYQFTTHNALNRARIKTVQGQSWLTVPVLTKGRSGQSINSVEINRDQKWKEKHLRTLHINYIYAAFFEQYIDALEVIFRKQWRWLVDLNMELISFIETSLGLEKEIRLSSDMSFEGRGSQKLIEMLEHTGCTTYLANQDLADYLCNEDFKVAGYKLNLIDYKPPVYHQQFDDFVTDLSCIDLLLNEGPDSLDILLKHDKQIKNAD